MNGMFGSANKGPKSEQQNNYLIILDSLLMDEKKLFKYLMVKYFQLKK